MGRISYRDKGMAILLKVRNEELGMRNWIASKKLEL